MKVVLSATDAEESMHDILCGRVSYMSEPEASASNVQANRLGRTNVDDVQTFEDVK
jgi:hypothetical protein